jgi:hypothetical protein
MREPLRSIDAIEEARRMIERRTGPLLHGFFDDHHAAHRIKAPPANVRVIQWYSQRHRTFLGYADGCAALPAKDEVAA